VPLRVAEGGAIRVGNTRIPLDQIVHEFERGATPEEIVQSFDALDLADVYSAIGYFLRHREEVEEYLRVREQQADRIRQMIEANQPPGLSKDELLRRQFQIRRQKMARLLADMRDNSVVLPPGSPSTTELLREDRDR
jgi:uncharacterized protein (DUF433 family)